MMLIISNFATVCQLTSRVRASGIMYSRCKVTYSKMKVCWRTIKIKCEQVLIRQTTNTLLTGG